MKAPTKALLAIGGEAPPYESVAPILGDVRFICAADSGLDTLRAWGLMADLVVGDMDSIADPSILSDYPEVMVFPRDKDDSDTEIGLRELRRRGYDRIAMVGGGGGRLDHLLALRALFERPSGPDEWFSPGGRVVRIDEPTSFEAKAGDLVSVFPLSGGAFGMSSSGLKWPLEGLSWNQGGFGLSNEALGDRFSIDPGQRPVLVVLGPAG